MAADQRREKVLKISDQHVGQRLDVYLAQVIPDFSRSQLKKLINEGQVEVEGEKAAANYRVRENEMVRVRFEEHTGNLVRKPLPLEILFEDEHLIVINKAAGVLVHAGAGEHGTTLAEGLKHYLNQNWTDERSGIVHRLDKDTTGAIVCAKSPSVHEALAKQFAAKTNLRVYVALLDGLIDSRQVSTFVGREPNHRTRFHAISDDEYQRLVPSRQKSYRRAESEFTRVRDFGSRLCLCEVKLMTGRTHQIRVHAKFLNRPVIGDQLYGRSFQPGKLPHSVSSVIDSVDRQMLHARYLGFDHPTSGKKLAFEAPLPNDFASLLTTLEGLNARPD